MNEKLAGAVHEPAADALRAFIPAAGLRKAGARVYLDNKKRGSTYLTNQQSGLFL